jgi:hypothetical protein
MTRVHNSNTTTFNTDNTDARNAQDKMDWSFSWEFDWSPAAGANSNSMRDTQHRTGADELGHMLDKALAYAG